MMRTAIVVGVHGQDGRLLNSYLLEKGYRIVGLDRNVTVCSDGTVFSPIDVTNSQQVFSLIKEVKPDEIYYLAAFHNSAEAKTVDNISQLQQSLNVNVVGVVNFLEGVRCNCPGARIFYAASSHIFGDPACESQDERTAISPNSIYGMTKASGVFACRMYRETHSLFAAVGILYNHESTFRGMDFVSKKIITGAINIMRNGNGKLIVGDLNAEVDWGYAPDYVDAMYKIVNHSAADDFVVASGRKHKVGDFIETAFGFLGLDWRQHVEENKAIIARKSYCRVGNPRKLMDCTGWKPSVDFSGMIERLIIAERAALEKESPLGFAGSH